MFQGIMILLVASILVKEIVDVFKPVLPQESKAYFYASILVGILFAFTLSLDIFSLLGFTAAIPYVGIVSTGLVISQGSNVVHDLIKRISNVKEGEAEATIDE